MQPASKDNVLPPCLPGGKDDDNALGKKKEEEAYLCAIGEAVRRSDADAVILSEGCHNCAEMMTLHHRIVRHLVTECGFNTVVTETGLPESRDIYDYVLGKCDFVTSGDGNGAEVSVSDKNRGGGGGEEDMWIRGLNKMYSAWEEGRGLIRWMRDHNSQLLKEGRNDDSLLRYYGSDIGGFYSDWRPPILKISHYLKDVDPMFEDRWMGKMRPLLEIMGTSARLNFQKKLTKEQRYEIKGLLNELVNYLHANESTFASHPCGCEELEWAQQSAMSMQLAERYYRNYEARSGQGPALTFEDGGVGLNVREIAMARNTLWVMRQRPHAKVIIISHVIHSKTETQHQDELWGYLVPMGQMLKQKVEEGGKSVFVIGTTYGRGNYWKKWQKGEEERCLTDVPPPKPAGIERAMCCIGEGKSFFLHWEKAPLEAMPFLWRTLPMRENDYFIKLRPAERNACIHLERISGAAPSVAVQSTGLP